MGYQRKLYEHVKFFCLCPKQFGLHDSDDPATKLDNNFFLYVSDYNIFLYLFFFLNYYKSFFLSQTHYFKFIIKSLKLNGNEVIVTARNKDVTFALLEAEKIKYASRGNGANSTFGKLLYLIWGSLLLTWIGKRNKVDMYIGFGSPYAAFASFVNGKKSVILDDTENALLGQSFYRRFATTILIALPLTMLPSLSPPSPLPAAPDRPEPPLLLSEQPMSKASAIATMTAGIVF